MFRNTEYFLALRGENAIQSIACEYYVPVSSKVGSIAVGCRYLEDIDRGLNTHVQETAVDSQYVLELIYFYMHLRIFYNFSAIEIKFVIIRIRSILSECINRSGCLEKLHSFFFIRIYVIRISRLNCERYIILCVESL